MPYLEFLRCEDCGEQAPLALDYAATIRAYNEDGRKESFINPATVVWDYLIYTCGVCGKQHRYTYRDVERRVREHLSAISRKYRKYFDVLVQYQEDEKSRKEGTFFVDKEPEIRRRIEDLYQNKD